MHTNQQVCFPTHWDTLEIRVRGIFRLSNKKKIYCMYFRFQRMQQSSLDYQDLGVVVICTTAPKW